MADDNLQILQDAHCEFKKQNFKPAEELYTQFISSCSQSRECEASDLATAFNNRGQIKYLRVDFREAVDDFSSAIKVDKQFEIPFYNRGLVHYRLDFRRGFLQEILPISSVYTSLLGIDVDTGFFDDAKSDFEQVLKLNPDFEDAKVSLQQTLLDQQHKINRGY